MAHEVSLLEFTGCKLPPNTKQLTMEDKAAGETHYEKMVVINKIAMITFPIVAVTFNTIYFIAVFTTN